MAKEKSELEIMVFQSVKEALANALPKQKKYLTKKDVCSECGVSLATVNNWMRSGIIKPLRIGGRVLFDSGEVDKTIKAGALKRYQRVFRAMERR